MDLSTLGGGGVKSIQRGLVTVNSTVDITVSAVNMSKSTLNCIHFGAGYNSIASRPEGYAYLFSENKIRFNGGGGFYSPVGWELIEYE
ncbi:hypothetical protein L5M43_20280 [Shewanella sp. SW36]|uniref:hypothetical protein n=1 Tax=unclassified Shewanella TaxID=196818 RepID=UPI0021D8F70B|nr:MULTISPECIES: hypothetical protein [unclassified Shewanella]MCU7977559.1 hypothetical protein [Shewanella sp. SW36]MCU7992817.1 hypothetical protein [Shewanella sp. SW1]MCU8054062.1 hypothetical protein [Shewanella sp. SM43]